MFIKTVVIKNFRALESVTFDLTPRANVIVGPNAVGKTTILQAIRLLKALLATRSTTESQQALISLGASSPHFPQRVFLAPLARDINKDIEIRCSFCLSTEEVAIINAEMDGIVERLVQAQFGQAIADPANRIQFMESPIGKDARAKAKAQLESAIKQLGSNNEMILGLTMKPHSQQMSAINPVSGILLSYLDQRLPPFSTVFSYFPADRALPAGEVGVQLGAADTQQQIESHNSQPQLKYQRLKNLIFNNIIMGPTQRQSLMDEFGLIFKEILRGRRIKSIGLNELGLLSVMIEDLETGREYEIDSLSSGEKGLALTFLIIAKSVERGGIVLLDEPELHLNPAVSKDVLGFMMKYYSKPRNIQFILCTHSPEILSGAFQNEECALLHVVSEKNVTRVGHKAFDEYSDALLKLGTTVSEGLLYRGTVFVEGDDDVALLELGFGETLRRYRLKDRGGRKEVEKAAKKLQELERNGEAVDQIFLIFDRDEEITDLKNSAAVRILQWNRRCIENYLLDTEVIAQLLKRDDIALKPFKNEGEVSDVLRTLAMKQLDSLVARAIYSSREYESPGARVSDFDGGSASEIADALYKRASGAKKSLTVEDESAWKQLFLQEFEQKKSDLTPVWESKWKEECDGKRLFSDLQKLGILKTSTSNLKRKIVEEMRNSKSENWLVVNSLLQALISPNA